MSEILCQSCDSHLEEWNFTHDVQMRFCPNCGTSLTKEQRKSLHHLVTDSDIDDHIRGKLLSLLEDLDGGELGADELAERAWEAENVDGVVFYLNRKADQFVTRHLRWVDEALEYVCDNIGEAEYFTKMKAGCNDAFLVVAFIEATRIYLHNQLGIDINEGKLSKERLREVVRKIKETPYRAEW